MPIQIMYCWARSGGSMMNRCLAMLPNTVVMSEVSPLFTNPEGKFSIAFQAAKWYGITLRPGTFAENVSELYEHCEKNGKHLIIRDHCFKNFFSEVGDQNKLLTHEALKDKFELKTFLFMRNPIDAWVSYGQTEPQHYFGSFNRFMDFMEQQQVRMFRYENFVVNPEEEMKAICAHIGIEYADSFLQQREVKNYNGDIRGRGLKSDKFVALPRKIISPLKIWQLQRSAEMHKLQQRLGYPDSFFSSPIEGWSGEHTQRIWMKIFG